MSDTDGVMIVPRETRMYLPGISIAVSIAGFTHHFIHFALRSCVLFLLFLHVTCRVSSAQTTDSAGSAIGARTARDGFRNEDDIRDKLNHWKTNADARAWLAAMHYEIQDIKHVMAMKPHGEKADVEVTVQTASEELQISSR